MPLQEDAYELVVPEYFLDLPGISTLHATLRRPAIRAQVEALGGCDGGAMGEVV